MGQMKPEDAPVDALCVSDELRRALDPAALSQRYHTAPLLCAIAMLTSAAQFLTLLGGRVAASETMRHTAGRIDQGEFPEPTHPAGNA